MTTDNAHIATRARPDTMRYGLRNLLLCVAFAVAAGACDSLEAPNYNAGDFNELRNNPTRSSIGAAVTGLTITTRQVYAEDDNDYVSMLGILGRESYVLDGNDPRFVTEMLEGNLNPGSGAFGGNFWARPYQNIRMSDVILRGLDQLDAGEMSDAEKAATRGFVKTWKAIDLLVVVITRDENCDGTLGCPVEVTEDVQELAPPVGKRAVYDEIERLLDDGNSDLQSAGSTAFPFELHSGFDGFETPSTFREFNRALAARVDVYLAGEFDLSGKFQEALDDLDASFMELGGDFREGVYHTYSTASGDVPNGLFQPSSSPIYRAHWSFREGARLQADGETLDQRYLDKSRPIDAATLRGVGSTIGFSLYPSADSPVPIIRNEELILLAAEAYIGLGQMDAAEPYLNDVRTRSGGLPAVDLSGMSQEDALTELLYDKRYSLWAEGGHRWIDARRYGRLDELPLDCPNPPESTIIVCGTDIEHQVNARYPIPIDEQLARQ